MTSIGGSRNTSAGSARRSTSRSRRAATGAEGQRAASVAVEQPAEEHPASSASDPSGRGPLRWTYGADAMPIWKLEPTSQESEFWEASTYRGTVIVRAPDEQVARQRATEVFGIAVKVRHGRSSPLPPWKDPTLARCARVKESGYPEDGPTKVLEPPHYDHE